MNLKLFQMHAPPVKPAEVMQLIEWLDEKQVELLTPSLLGPHPNCYTFSKRLAESVVESEFSNLPTVIVRPSIGKRNFIVLYLFFFVLSYFVKSKRLVNVKLLPTYAINVK